MIHLKKLVAIGFACLPLAFLVAPKGVAAELDRAQVEQIVHDYLLDHPEVIRDAIAELQRREDAAQKKAALDAVESNRALLVASPHQAVLGNPKGDITVVEFFDYNCPYCRQSAGDITTILGEDRNVRVVLKEWPILGSDSVEAAQVSIAARIQDGGARFQEFHEKLLGMRGRASRAAAVEAASAAGYDPQKIESDLNGDEAKKTIVEVASLAKALNVSGTPTFVIGKQAVAGAIGVDALRKLIGKAREDCKAQLC